MSMERAVMIEPAATGVRAVERVFGVDYKVGRSILVLGAGPIGLMVIAAMRYSGAGLIMVQDLLPARLERARHLGADLIIDGKLPFEERLKMVREATGGYGPDIVAEAAGAPAAFREALDFTRRGGKLIEVGHFTDTGSIEIRPFAICYQDIDIYGCRYSPMIFEDVISMLERTSLPVEEVVTHTFPLEELPRALEMTGSAEAAKVVITP
jgi:L-iditol 2-dehydrogenase